LLNKFADAVLAHGEELAQLESTDNGKNSAGAQMDVGFMVELLRFNAGAALNLGGQAMQRKDGFGFIRKEPVVAGCITPWNFPMLMTIFKMAPMLAAGSTGVFKTTELTPLSSLKLAEIWTNLPGSVPGVVNMVPGDGMIAGEAIVDHKDVNSIHFTGSTVIGQRIMTRSAQTLKRVHLELGGKSPFIVFDDANIGKAATIAAVFSTLNTGQFCASPTRFFVHEKVHD
jgi:acyl-CoA reductase-like NAD-dependent aldehyde dehydrogenase